MKISNYSLFVVSLLTLAFSVADFVMAMGQHRNLSPAEGGLFTAAAAIILLLLRVIYLENRLDEIDKKINGDDKKSKNI